VKYALIVHYEGEFSISLMCRVLSVSRSGYYSWKKRKLSKRQQRREQFELLIKDTYEDFLSRYGSRRITKELNAAGIPCSLNFVANIMHDNIIKAHNGKGFNYRHQSLTMVNVADNLLWREFSAQGPNEKWTTDITYIWVRNM
jgi:putative transposase